MLQVTTMDPEDSGPSEEDMIGFCADLLTYVVTLMGGSVRFPIEHLKAYSAAMDGAGLRVFRSDDGRWVHLIVENKNATQAPMV